jgi:hypothetical protein
MWENGRMQPLRHVFGINISGQDMGDFSVLGVIR